MEDDSLFHEKAFFACYSASCLGSYTYMTTKNSRGITPHSRFSSTGEILLQSFLVNLICYGIERIHCCISYICLAVVIIPNRKNWGGGIVFWLTVLEVELSWQKKISWKTQFIAVGPYVGGCPLTMTDQEPE